MGVNWWPGMLLLDSRDARIILNVNHSYEFLMVWI